MSDLDSTQPSQPIHTTSTKTRTMEQRRAMLRLALQNRPSDAVMRQALYETLSPTHIRRAARRGVYVSYHRADELFALEVELALRHVCPVWLDVISIPDSADWHTEVNYALQQCGVMVVVLSPHANQDPDIQRERHYFLESGKVLIQVQYRADSAALPHLIIPPIDCRQQRAEGLRDLSHLLSSPSAV